MLRPAAFHLRLHHIHSDWHLIPGATFERATRPLFLHSAPLLEEKWDFDSQALIPNVRDPFLHDRSCAGTRLAADDHPIDILEIQLPKRTDQWLKRQEFDFCARFPEGCVCVQDLIYKSELISSQIVVYFEI